jgi:hypothetical protein
MYRTDSRLLHASETLTYPKGVTELKRNIVGELRVEPSDLAGHDSERMKRSELPRGIFD